MRCTKENKEAIVGMLEGAGAKQTKFKTGAVEKIINQKPDFLLPIGLRVWLE